MVDNNSTNGTYVNGQRIHEPRQLQPGDKIFIGDFVIELDNNISLNETAALSTPPPPPGPNDESLEAVLADDEWAAGDHDSQEWGEDWGDEIEMSFEESLDGPIKTAVSQQSAPPIKTQGLVESIEEIEVEEVLEEPQILENPPTQGDRPAIVARTPEPENETPQSHSSEFDDALRTIHERLVRSMDLRRLSVEAMSEEDLRVHTEQNVREIVSAMLSSKELSKKLDRDSLIQSVLNETLGLGALESLLKDDSVTEILVNSAKQVYVERAGRLELSDLAFSSDQAVIGVIERIVAPIGRRIDESSPMVDARLKDGSRVNAVIPPLALNGPTLTIRKFSKIPLSVKNLVEYGTLTPQLAEFLRVSVEARRNIIISGGTGSGKTTTLNVLSSYIPDDERIITIEDAAELKLNQAHIVRLESRPPNIEGRGAVIIRDLVRNALRMRPDRIIVGECRGGETLDMLQAMNTGHDGSLTTIHANTPRDALSRLETMVLMSGMDLPVRAIRNQVSSAIDIVVQQTRFPDGSRRITHISEITGMEGDIISMQDIFLYHQTGYDEDGKIQGEFKPTGLVPQFFETLRSRGVSTDLSIFQMP